MGVQCKYNYANNGAWIYSIGASNLSIRNSSIKYNYAAQMASALYFLGASMTSITSTEISNNFAKSEDAIYQLFTPLTLVNVTFINNAAEKLSAGIFVAFSTLNIQNSTFKNTQFPSPAKDTVSAAANSQINGWFVSVSSGATLTITDSQFDSGYANYGGAIYVSGNSKIVVSYSDFINWYAFMNGGAIYATGFQTITLSNWEFEGNSWGITGTDLWFKSGESNISNTNFKLIAGPSSIYLEGGYFYAKNINISSINMNIIQRNYELFGSGITGISMNYFSLFNSSISNINYGINGGAILLTRISSTKTKIPQNPNYNSFNSFLSCPRNLFKKSLSLNSIKMFWSWFEYWN